MSDRFSKFDLADLKEGLRQMEARPTADYTPELKAAIKDEIAAREANPDYEQECRARKVLSGGYDPPEDRHYGSIRPGGYYGGYDGEAD